MYYINEMDLQKRPCCALKSCKNIRKNLQKSNKNFSRVMIAVHPRHRAAAICPTAVQGRPTPSAPLCLPPTSASGRLHVAPARHPAMSINLAFLAPAPEDRLAGCSSSAADAHRWHVHQENATLVAAVRPRQNASSRLPGSRDVQNSSPRPVTPRHRAKVHVVQHRTCQTSGCHLEVRGAAGSLRRSW